MEKINHLKDLFIYELQNLYAAEEQVAMALTAMIKKAKHSSLKNALKNYQLLTEEHKNRLKDHVGRKEKKSLPSMADTAKV